MACRAVLRRVPVPSSISSSSSSSIAATPSRISSFTNTNHVYRHRIRCVHLESKQEETTLAKNVGDGQLSESWKIKMLYDGECPLCMREVHMLKERNKQYGTIKFVDISSSDYSPEKNQGLAYETVMGRIHAILSDGTIVTDVQAFKRLYEEVGLGWVYAITKYEPIATIANAVYSIWAKYRLQITGRPSLEEVLELRRKQKTEGCTDNGTCKR